MMHLHIVGICGTFMGSLAQLAVAKGYRVTGSDANVYPPMSTQLQQAGIDITEGFSPGQLAQPADLYIIGNAISRGNPLLEAILDQGLAYTSGPGWLSQHILPGRWVLAVAGTHGKTTTSSMLAWILEYAGMSPGYLIGGVPDNFSVSARLGDTPFFVIEADEYDSAFFDKRSKFVHYRPRTLVINNLEYDHADIFPDLAAIQRQFHHVVRTVPQNGLVITPAHDVVIDEVLAMGCWTPLTQFSLDAAQPADAQWCIQSAEADGSAFDIAHNGVFEGRVEWSLLGTHNIANGLAALIAARHVGVSVALGCEALAAFKGVKRRLETLANVHHTTVYDDFAHHPSAIKTTLAGLRAKLTSVAEHHQAATGQGRARIIAIIEPRSNTMRMGEHQAALADACVDADTVVWYKPDNITWDIDTVIAGAAVPMHYYTSIEAIVEATVGLVNPSDEYHIVIMSNGGFGGIHEQLIQRLHEEYPQ